MYVYISHLLCQHGAGQGNEAPASEEVEALHQLTGSPSDLDCSWTGKDTQKSHVSRHTVLDHAETDNQTE